MGCFCIANLGLLPSLNLDAALTLSVSAEAALARHSARPQVYSVVSIPPRPIRVLKRGEVENPGAAVTPGALSCVGVEFPRVEGDEGRRRLALADWIVADALGMHLDLFQRITVGPASVSIIHYGEQRPDVVATNTDSGDLSWLRTAKPEGDAAVGGGAGHEPAGSAGSASA